MIPFRVPYEDMRFVWVSDHCDVHLAGLCRVDGKLVRFETVGLDRGQELECMLYPLTASERRQWLVAKNLFEICVGRHWTYLPGKRPGPWRLKRPYWFWRWVMNAYYRWLRDLAYYPL